MRVHRLVMIVLAAAVVAGCASNTKHARPTLRQTLSRMVFPEIDFKDADTAGVLAYMLNVANIAATAQPLDETAAAEVLRAKGVAGRITISMRDVTFVDAVRAIAKKAGLGYSISNAGLLFINSDGVPLTVD